MFTWGDMKLTIEEDKATLVWYCLKWYEREMSHADVDLFMDFCIRELELEDEDEPEETIMSFAFDDDYYDMYFRDVRTIAAFEDRIAEHLSV